MLKTFISAASVALTLCACSPAPPPPIEPPQQSPIHEAALSEEDAAHRERILQMSQRFDDASARYQAELVKARINDRYPLVLGIDRAEISEENGDYWILSMRPMSAAPGRNAPSGPASAQWRIRRLKLWVGGRTKIDWASSTDCPGIGVWISRLPSIRPRLEFGIWNQNDFSEPRYLSLAIVNDYTIWTTWSAGEDLRYTDIEWSELGKWGIQLEEVLAPCWHDEKPPDQAVR